MPNRFRIPQRQAMATDRKLTKSAGEHYVCAILAQRGWAASLTRDGLERTDILAVQTHAAEGVGERPMVEVQVKASSPTRRPSWMLGRKGTIPSESGREWYVFVLLGELGEATRYWIVPRDHVAAATWIGHMSWLTSADAPPGKRNAGIEAARIGAEVWACYENRWELLEQPAEDAPVLLPAWMEGKLDDPNVGLPPDHPWRDGAPPWVRE